MYYIKLEGDMNLVTTVREPIYRGDNLSRKITFLIPEEVGEINVLAATVYLTYIRADGEPDVVILERKDNLYANTWYQFTIPVTCRMTRFAGEVIMWLQIFSGDTSNPVVAKSGENVLRVMESKELDGYYGDQLMTAIYQLNAFTQETADNATTDYDELSHTPVFNVTGEPVVISELNTGVYNIDGTWAMTADSEPRDTKKDDLFYVLREDDIMRLTWISAGKIIVYTVPVNGLADDVTEKIVAMQDDIAGSLVGDF